jgi:parallel beta-helix repeat protein
LDNNISHNFKNGLYIYENRLPIFTIPPQPPPLPHNNTVSNNVISFNEKNGIYLYSSNNTIENNVIFNNSEDGISIADVYWTMLSPSPLSNNYITNNNISANKRYGVFLDSSHDNYVLHNNFVDDGVFISGYNENHVISNTISDDNMVNGKPLCYLKNQDGLEIDGEDIGQLILANCTNMRIANLQLDNTDTGIELAYSNDILMEDNSFAENLHGIYLFKSSFNTIMNNDITTSENSGIYLSSSESISSSNNTIESNTILCNRNGICFESLSNDNNIKNNNITNGGENGIYFASFVYSCDIIPFSTDPSTDNNIEDNVIGNNMNHGICLNSSYNTTIINNTIFSNANDGIYVRDQGIGPMFRLPMTHSWKIIVNDNKILNNGHNGITLIPSSNNSIVHNLISFNGNDGIFLHGSFFHQTRFNYITSNNITNNNNIGINLSSSQSNMIMANNISYSGNYGLYIRGPPLMPYSTNNLIYHNNFIDNTNQAYDGSGDNFWNDTYPSGGNYWSDYTGLDIFHGPGQNISGSDDIGDSWYVINTKGKDKYPLMYPWIFTVPGAPQNPVAISGDSHVNILWDPPTFDGRFTITNYKLYRGISSGSESFFMDLGDVLFYNDTSVKNGVTYYYKVSAENEIGEGPKSNETNATPSSVPSQPLNLQATTGDEVVNLSWDVPINDGGFPIMNYTIFRDTTSGGETFLVKIGNISYYNDTNVSNGNTYYYKVCAENILGESKFSNEVSATPGVPTAPRNLAAVCGDALVGLTWSTPVSDGGFPIIAYRIYRGTTSGGKTFLAELGVQLSYDDTNVSNQVTYYYVVSAVNIFAESPFSNEVSATPGVPTEPKAIAAKAGDSHIYLSWNPPDSEGGFPITNYLIYRGISPGEETFLTEIGKILYYNDTDVTNGIKYYYKVSARNEIGEGSLSQEVSATPATLPGTPENLVAHAGDSYVNLNWEAPSLDGGFPVTNYRIYRGNSSGEENFLFEIGNNDSYNDTSVSNGVTYYYTVRAINKLGEGPKSNEVEDTPLGVPSVPYNLAVIVGDSYVNLTWNAPVFNGCSPILNYTIYRGSSRHEVFFLEDIGNITFYNDTSVINEVMYYYEVSALNKIGEGSSSNVIEAKPYSPFPPSNQLPTCSITSLSSGTIISGKIEISGFASDFDGIVQYVEVKIDTGEWMQASGSSSWTYSLDTTTLTNGEHRLYARSYDGEDYSQEKSVDITVDNDLILEEKSIFEEGWFWFLVIAIIMVAVVIILILLKMRKKPTEDVLKENKIGSEDTS